MGLAADEKRLTVVETVAGQVVRAQTLPGIDIGPLLDALMQFLLQLLEDCPMAQIREAAEKSAKRPVLRWFWRRSLTARLPEIVTDKLPDAAADLLAAGAAMSPAQWAALGD